MPRAMKFSEDLGKPNPLRPVFRDPPGPGLKERTYMNMRMWAAWDAVVAELGFAPTIVQGAYMRDLGGGAADASSHTHDLGGCIDTRTWDLSDELQHKILKVARQVGWAVWKRTRPPFDEEHMHWVLLGDESAHAEAKGQMAQYESPDGGDGLAGHGKDPHFRLRPDPIVIFDYDKYLEDQDMDINEKVPRTPDDNTVAAALRASIRLEKAFGRFREGELARDKALRQQLRDSNKAIRAQLAALDKEVAALPNEAITKAELRRILNSFKANVQRGLIPDLDLANAESNAADVLDD